MEGTENIHPSKSQIAGTRWDPIIGEETEGLLTRIFADDFAAKEKIKRETHFILKLCGNPREQTNEETGLVFGYVQSGKTLSFTTLTAMARDNGYQMVIIIAGTSTNLVNQSYSRLEKDLQVNEGWHRKWRMINNPQNPSKNSQDKNAIKQELDSWKNPSGPPNSKKTLLITVMKNKDHLPNLIQILSQLDLNKVPTLIIDDEADQASMNNRAYKNAKRERSGEILSEVEMSTLYRRIGELKNALPHHTFIQYTATPQAPLFIAKLDILSPNFIQLLTPGDQYTGGKAFFKENHFLVREIPEEEIFSDENYFTETPDSLMEALRIFFLGVASGRLFGAKKGNPRNRSMMVHPSRLVEDHGIYFNWVKNVKNHWAKVLDRDQSDETRMQLVQDLHKAYMDLKENIQQLQSFEELLEYLAHNINATAVEQLNSRSGSLVDWNGNYAFILVGGQAMDRGFTVEGLTVTYMPRSKGVGNADTIQQRARFFGYKSSYLGYCRVYLDVENIHLFGEYVDHEEDIRNKLKSHKISGQHLNALDRQFVLNEMFKLTRKSVLSDELERSVFGNRWFRIKAPHDNDSIIDHNRIVTKVFRDKYNSLLEEDPGHPDRTEDQVHFRFKISLKDLFHELLEKLKFTRLSDSESFTSLKAIIALYDDEFPPEDCFVYFIKKGKPRKRSLNSKDEILNLFQGKNPKTGPIIYPGDEKVRMDDYVSVQIHTLDIKKTDLTSVIGLAVWIPKRLSKSLIKIKKSD